MRIKIVAQSNISVVVSTSLLQKTKQRTLLLCFFCPTIEIKMKNISPSSCEKWLKIARKFPVLTVFCLGWRGSWWWRLIWSPAMLMSSTMRASLVRKHFNTSPSSSHNLEQKQTNYNHFASSDFAGKCTINFKHLPVLHVQV